MHTPPRCSASQSFRPPLWSRVRSCGSVQEELAVVAWYLNDKQIHKVNYRWERSGQTRYSVRIWKI